MPSRVDRNSSTNREMPNDEEFRVESRVDPWPDVGGGVRRLGDRPEKGIDLAGGTILVYETAAKESSKSYKMDELIAVLRKRINPEGVQDVTIRPVGLNRVEIILPEATEEKVDEIKRQLTDTGSLEFRILANEKHDAAGIRRVGFRRFGKSAERLRLDPRRRNRLRRRGAARRGQARAG